MRHSHRPLSILSVLLACASAGQLAAQAAQPAHAGKAGQGGAGQPTAPANPNPADTTTPAAADAPAQPAAKPKAEEQTPPPTESRADLRTFGGPCINPPRGANNQFGAFAAALIPQLVGAGVDALTAALEAAGRDRPFSQSTVVALENAVECVQVARDVTTPSGDEGLRDAVKAAPFLVEFYLRQSADGSALLVTPTLLNYRQTLDDRQAHSRRTLYATLAFRDASGEQSTTVTVPIGAYATSATPYPLDPIRAPYEAKDFMSLGAANSIWIPNPFHRVASRPAQPPAAADAAAPRPAGAGSFGSTARVHATGDGTQPAAKDQAPAPTQPADILLLSGTRIAPLSITVTITEIRPGSGLARTLATLLHGARSTIVDAADPAQREQAREQERTAAATRLNALLDARVKYSEAYHAYCDAQPGTAAQRATAPNLYAAQMRLLAARLAAGSVDAPPFAEPIDPEAGYNEQQRASYCPAPL